ncbi:MAG: glycosyltransferase [Chloroflexi bacterium]|nr:glycosyltransferase [Chloroflexota bacterium]
MAAEDGSPPTALGDGAGLAHAAWLWILGTPRELGPEMEDRLRLLYVIDSLKIGGAEMLLLGMARRYLSEGHEIRIAYFSEGGLHKDFEALGIPLTRLSQRGLKDPRALTRLVNLIRTYRPDVIHTHLFKSDLVGQIGAALTRVPARISTLHNTSQWRKNPLFSGIMRGVMLPCDRIIAVTQYVRDYAHQWSHYPLSRMIVIENGVDTIRFDPDHTTPLDRQAVWGLAPDSPVIGVIGRLHPAKGHDILLRAAVEIVREVPTAQLIIIGDGELRAALESLSIELSLQDHVVFTGFMRDMPGVMAALDVVVFSSRWEGLPVTLLEAMSMGRPVVATSVGGIPDVLTHETNGLLVLPDNPAALAQEVLRILRDVTLAGRLGKSAQETICERYSADVMVQRIMKLYREILEAKKQPCQRKKSAS